jgi:hypothetical protein
VFSVVVGVVSAVAVSVVVGFVAVVAPPPQEVRPSKATVINVKNFFFIYGFLLFNTVFIISKRVLNVNDLVSLTLLIYGIFNLRFFVKKHSFLMFFYLFLLNFEYFIIKLKNNVNATMSGSFFSARHFAF